MVGTLVKKSMEDVVFFMERRPRLAKLSEKGFAALAGLATNLRPLEAEAVCCVGPQGTGYCGNTYCGASGGGCLSSQGCSYYISNCNGVQGASCWCAVDAGYTQCSGVRCCDCLCTNPPPWHYCYCRNRNIPGVTGCP
jgi:hypothetical protein